MYSASPQSTIGTKSPNADPATSGLAVASKRFARWSRASAISAVLEMRSGSAAHVISASSRMFGGGLTWRRVSSRSSRVQEIADLKGTEDRDILGYHFSMRMSTSRLKSPPARADAVSFLAICFRP